VLRDLTEPTRDGSEPALEATEVVTFQGEGGSLAVAYRPGEPGVYIFGSDLPAPPQGKVYEVWMIDEDTPVPGPCLTPRADGSLFTYVEAELGTTETMAVTVEPSSCPSAPTGEPILTADLTAA
jgi:anti-sigma-K factor RskA